MRFGRVATVGALLLGSCAVLAACNSILKTTPGILGDPDAKTDDSGKLIEDPFQRKFVACKEDCNQVDEFKCDLPNLRVAVELNDTVSWLENANVFGPPGDAGVGGDMSGTYAVKSADLSSPDVVRTASSPANPRDLSVKSGVLRATNAKGLSKFVKTTFEGEQGWGFEPNADRLAETRNHIFATTRYLNGRVPRVIHQEREDSRGASTLPDQVPTNEASTNYFWSLDGFEPSADTYEVFASLQRVPGKKSGIFRYSSGSMEPTFVPESEGARALSTYGNRLAWADTTSSQLNIVARTEPFGTVAAIRVSDIVDVLVDAERVYALRGGAGGGVFSYSLDGQSQLDLGSAPYAKRMTMTSTHLIVATLRNDQKGCIYRIPKQ
jgi:hypothetical protein